MVTCFSTASSQLKAKLEMRLQRPECPEGCGVRPATAEPGRKGLDLEEQNELQGKVRSLRGNIT